MPNPPVGGLAQAFLDPFNEPIAESLPPELPEIPDDPVTAILLADPDLDPVTKAIFRQRADEKKKLAKVEAKLAAMKIEEESPGIVAFLGPVPVGLQVGTYFGIKNPILRFATDLVVDPLTLVTGIGLGVKGAQGLTKLGRATKYLAGMSVADKLDTVSQGAKLLGRTILDEGLAEQLSTAALARDYKSIAKAVKETKKFKFTDEALDAVGQVDQDLAKLLRGDRGELRELGNAMEVGDKIKGRQLQESFLGRVLDGQAAFLNFGIPFTDIELGGLRLPNLLKAMGVTATRSFGDVGTAEKAIATVIGEVAGRPPTKIIPGIGPVSGRIKQPVVRDSLDDLGTTTLRAIAGGMDIRQALKLPSDLPDAIKTLETTQAALEESGRASLKQITQVFDIPEQEAFSAALGLVREVEHRSGLDPRDLGKFLPRAMKINEAQKIGGVAKYLAKALGRDTETIVKAFRDDPTSLQAFKDFVNANLANQALDGLKTSAINAKTLAKQTGYDIGNAYGLLVNELTKPTSGIAAVSKLLARLEHRTGDLGVTAFDLVHRKIDAAGLDAKINQAVKRRIGDILEDRTRFADEILQKQFNAQPLALPGGAGAAPRAGPGAMTPGLPGGAASTAGAAARFAQELAQASMNPATGGNVLELEKDISHFKDLVDGTYMAKTYDGATTWAATGKPLGVVMLNYLHAVRQTGTNLKTRVQLILGGNAPIDEFLATLREHQAVAGANLHPAHLAMMDNISRFFDNTFQTAKQGGILADADYIKGYVPHLIDWKDKKLRDLYYETSLPALVQRIGTAHPKPGFAKPRVFDTMEDLDAFLKKFPSAFTWRSKKLSDVIEAYAHGMGTAIVRNQFLDFLDTAKTINNHPMLLQKGVQEGSVRVRGTLLTPTLIKRGGALPGGANLDDYMDVDNPALKRFLFHKEIGPYVRTAFERDLLRDVAGGGGWRQAFDVLKGKTDAPIWERLGVLANVVNDIGKSPIFRLAPFHMTNLFLGTLGLMPFKEAVSVNFQVAAAMRKSAKEVTQSAMDLLSRGVSQSDVGGKVLNGSDLVKRAVFSGVHLGRGDLGAIDYFQNALKWAAENAPRPLKSPLTGLSHINEVFDKNLWEVTQNGLKVISWTHLRQTHILKDPSLLADAEKLFKVENDLATAVNVAYGGLGWERMLVTSNARTVLRLSLIASDWTISNLLYARDLFVNIPGVKEGVLGKVLRTSDVLLPDLRFRQAMQYNLRLGLYTFLGANMMNYLFSGKFLWDADKAAYDKDTGIPRVELPYVDYKGRKQYMDTYKQFIEPWQWMRDPIGSLNRKMGVLPHIFKTLVVGTDSFGTPIAGTQDGPYLDLIKRIGATTGQFLPISARAGYSVLAGARDPRSAAISSFGFPVRSEGPAFQKQRQTMETLEAEVAMLKAQGVR